MRKTLSVIGATALLLALASPALAEENVDSTFGAATFTQTMRGVTYDWHIEAGRDNGAGTTMVIASYSSAVDTTCRGGDQDGQPGYRFISFTGHASAPVLIPANLGFAIAGARIHGPETVFDSCTNSETTVDRSYTIALALRATARAVTSSGQKCANEEQMVSSTFTFRTAAGSAVINGRRSAVTDGILGHDVATYEPDPSCANL